MALMHVNFSSAALGMGCSMDVIVPEQRQYPQPAGRKKYPVLYLLHGLSDDQTSWQRRTSLERYLAGRELVVVMPTTHRCFYSNTVSQQKYFDFIAQELPEICASFFPISTKREDTFAAGNSMGGYGAFKLGLACPEKFGAVASLSGVLDVVSAMDTLAMPEKPYLFGSTEQLRGSENDLFFLADQLLAADRPRPHFLQICGTEDFLYNQNQAFLKTYGKGLNITYIETPGNHNWEYWDSCINTVLDWLPLQKR